MCSQYIRSAPFRKERFIHPSIQYFSSLCHLVSRSNDLTLSLQKHHHKSQHIKMAFSSPFQNIPTEASDRVSLATTSSSSESSESVASSSSDSSSAGSFSGYPFDAQSPPTTRQEFTASLCSLVRPRRGGIASLDGDATPPRRPRYYRSSIYARIQQQQQQQQQLDQGASAISLATASSLYSRHTDDDDDDDDNSNININININNDVDNEDAIRAAQEALFGDWSFSAATKRAERRETKRRVKKFFAWLRRRIIALLRGCLCLPDRRRPRPRRAENREERENEAPWGPAHPSASYGTFMTGDVEGEGEGGDEVAPSCDGPSVYVSVFR
ncbi:hypothetical protein IWZ03DRAFT_371817 [Phyllosticta citriasiana]|uniref:Uncharacterized protein n=1 Tax=Phyllosticta citriasiana TaxID=595635 RepID=A0ABR1KSL0_9PEZI